MSSQFKVEDAKIRKACEACLAWNKQQLKEMRHWEAINAHNQVYGPSASRAKHLLEALAVSSPDDRRILDLNDASFVGRWIDVK